ncbi:protein GVQW3-like [Lycorma delicatula]|uniref:protein GVQW3-like n=1 Tax=Lycorma delicatula TaxID=130591 RepID=UPI003F512D91
MFRWFSAFKNKREFVEDEPRVGRPVSARADENVEKAKEIVANDIRITTRMLAVKLGVGKETAESILEKDLHKRKIYSRFVPHSLTKEQRQHRAAYCANFIAAVNDVPNLLKRILTGDESWCFKFDLETKVIVWNGMEHRHRGRIN